MKDTKSEILKAIRTAATKMEGPFDYNETAKYLDEIAAKSKARYDTPAKEQLEKDKE